MDISVVIPLFNVKKYVRECIDALILQDYPEDSFEIIMVDNNSSDETADIVKDYPRIKLLNETKQGSYCARNKGIRCADGELIAFTDPDCLPNPDWLSRLSAAASLPGRDIVLGKRDFAFQSNALSMLSDYESVKAEYVFSSESNKIYYGYTNNMAVRRSLFQKLGQFIEVDRGADTVFVRTAVDRWGCNIVHYSPDARIRHLEIVSIWDYYGKKLIYGKSNESNRSLGAARPLNSAERVNLFIQTIRSQRYSILKSFQLLVMLCLGMLAYEHGRLNAH